MEPLALYAAGMAWLAGPAVGGGIVAAACFTAIRCDFDLFFVGSLVAVILGALLSGGASYATGASAARASGEALLSASMVITAAAVAFFALFGEQGCGT